MRAWQPYDGKARAAAVLPLSGTRETGAGSPALAPARAVAVVAARWTALEALLGFSLRPGNLLARLLVDDLHGETHFAAVIEAQQLDPDLLALLDNVLHALRPAGGQ